MQQWNIESIFYVCQYFNWICLSKYMYIWFLSPYPHEFIYLKGKSSPELT